MQDVGDERERGWEKQPWSNGKTAMEALQKV